MCDVYQLHYALSSVHLQFEHSGDGTKDCNPSPHCVTSHISHELVSRAK